MVNCKGLKKDLCLPPDCLWVDKQRKFCRTAKNKTTKISSPIKYSIKIKRNKNTTLKQTPKTHIIKVKKKRGNKKTTKNNTKNINDIIIRELSILRDNELINRVFYKVKHYNVAIEAIKKDFKNTPLNSGKQLNDYKGIGDKIINKIDEIIQTGTLLEADHIMEENIYHDFMIQLSNIHGIGGKKAVELVEKHNIHSIEQLIKRQDEIQDNKRPLLNNIQKKGLEYFEDCQQRIPRKEMIQHDKYLSKLSKKINKLFPNTSLIVVGSYRREKKDSGDIDILITNKDNNTKVFDAFFKLMEEEQYITSTFSHGAKKFMGMCLLPKKNIHRRLDILYTPPTEYPFALLYFTGSGNFNTTLREYANTLGYRLNESSIKHYNLETKEIGEIIDVKFTNELDIFNFFKIPYIEPKNREKSTLQQLLPN